MPGYDPQQVALFRYQVIAPLVSLSGPRGTLKREMERIAIRSHDHPQQGPTHYSFATIEEWHYLYKREGFDGLLRSLHPDEVNGYLTFRLELAGRTAKLFCPDAVEAIGRAARGIPRLIDRVAEHSLLIALREKKKEIDCDMVTEAVEEVEP